MHARGNGRHVLNPGAAIIHMTEADRRNFVIKRVRNPRRLDVANFGAKKAREEPDT
jgi:hypothetical protein